MPNRMWCPTDADGETDLAAWRLATTGSGRWDCGTAAGERASTASARPANRRNQPRTVSTGRPSVHNRPSGPRNSRSRAYPHPRNTPSTPDTPATQPSTAARRHPRRPLPSPQRLRARHTALPVALRQETTGGPSPTEPRHGDGTDQQPQPTPPLPTRSARSTTQTGPYVVTLDGG
jgi:hypothetical protein